MWKLIALFALAIICVHAEEEVPKKDEPQPTSVMEMALCYGTPKPVDCLKAKTGRMLDYWEFKLNQRKERLLAEADEAMKTAEVTETTETTEKSDEQPKETPSKIMAEIEKDVSAIASVISGETEATPERTARSVLDNEAEEGRFKRKKKLKLLKLLHLGTFLKTKIIALVAMLSFHLLFKIFVLTLINMVVNAGQFFIGLKGHFKGGDSGGGILGGIFKRNVEHHEPIGVDYGQQLAYNNQYPGHQV